MTDGGRLDFTGAHSPGLEATLVPVTAAFWLLGSTIDVMRVIRRFNGKKRPGKTTHSQQNRAID
jgi:hypothetical protein